MSGDRDHNEYWAEEMEKVKGDTPRTDAEIKAVLSNGMGPLIVCHSFARQLERELSQWKQVADDLAVVVANEMLEEYGHRRPCPQLDAYNKLKGQ